MNKRVRSSRLILAARCVGILALTLMLSLASPGKTFAADEPRSHQPQRPDTNDLAAIADETAEALGWPDRVTYTDSYYAWVDHRVDLESCEGTSHANTHIYTITISGYDSPEWAQGMASPNDWQYTTETFHGLTGYRYMAPDVLDQRITWAMGNATLTASDRYTDCMPPGQILNPMPIAEAVYSAAVRHGLGAEVPPSSDLPGPSSNPVPNPEPGQEAIEAMIAQINNLVNNPAVPISGALAGTLIAALIAGLRGALPVPLRNAPRAGAATRGAPEVATAGPASSQILNIIQDNPQINGGPGDNSATSFDGGDGPGSCSINGLPNYWVSTANLNLYVEDTVYTYRGLGPTIVLKLSYNSAPGNAGMFGRNWRFYYESVIQQLPERLLLWKGSGQRLAFQLGARPRGQNPNAPVEALSLDGGRARLFDHGLYFLLVDPQSRLRYRYDKSGGTTSAPLTAIVDQNNNAVTLSYNPNGSLKSVTDAAGRVTSFAYDSSRRCVGFSLPDGRQAKYAYDARGNLVQAVDLLETVVVYEYDDRNSLVRMTVGRGQNTTTFTYQDRGHGQYLASVTDAAGNSTRYELVSVQPRHVRVTDREGQSTSYSSTPQGYTERVVDPLGNTVVTSFANDLPVSFTDANQHTSRMEYDARGNLIRRVDPLGAAWARTYDGNDRLVSETDPLGAAWQYVYDGRGNLTRIMSPGGRAVQLEYDGKGQVVSIEDSAHNRLRLAYDAFGNAVSRTSQSGSGVHLTYNSVGMDLVVYTDARGNSTHYEYDANDRLTRMTYPDGTCRSFAYDCCAGVSVVDENGNQTNYRRDPLLMLSEQKDAMGASTTFTYDRNHRPVKVVDALGHTISFGYDAAGRRVRETNPLGRMIQAQYDPNGNLVALLNELGKTSSFEYDAANRLAGSTDPLGHVLTIKWDALRRPSEIIGARGGRVGLSYSRDGALVGKTYDGVGMATYEHDDTGHLSRLKDPTGIQSFAYDPDGQVGAIRYPDGTKVAFSYDEGRNLSNILYPGDLKVSCTYDGRDRLTKLTWNDQSISYQYDADGAVVREIRSNGVESAYTYDENGRLRELRHVRGGQPFVHVTYTRNANGDIVMETGSQPVSAQLAEIDGDFLYNDLDQVQSQGQEGYTYDADGNLTAISGNKWQAQYDLENRPQEVSRDGGIVTYQYNGLGQRVQAVTGGAVRKYHHDLSGRLLFEADGNGQVTCCYIYSGDRLAARYGPDGQSFFYHFNHQGSTLAVTDARGEIAVAYAYTPFGLLAGQSGVVHNNRFTFVGAYGVMDEGGGLYYMKNRYYDANTGRFIQKDPLGTKAGLNLYGYAGGNPSNRIDPLGLEVTEIQFATPKEYIPLIHLGIPTQTVNFVVGGYEALTGVAEVALAAVSAAAFGPTVAGASALAFGSWAMVDGIQRAGSSFWRNEEYKNPHYSPADSVADLIDPDKSYRGAMNWMGEEWNDLTRIAAMDPWGAKTPNSALNMDPSCPGRWSRQAVNE